MLGLTLGAGAGAATAEPSEPLTVTQLGDPEARLQTIALSGTVDRPISNGDLDDFGWAVSEAVRAQRQAIEARCRSANKATGPIAARWAWEARCRYQRY